MLFRSKSSRTKILEIPVSEDYDKELVVKDQVTEKDQLLKQQKLAKELISFEAPDRIIVIGGPCSAEQAPFDYLHGKYPDTGLIWIDVHPDITRTGDYPNEHAMVLGNLLGDGDASFASLVGHKFRTEDVCYAGMKIDEMETYEKKYMEDYRIHTVTPAMLHEMGSRPVLDWVKERGYRHLIVHWDLDVLSPKSFYSLLCNEPLSGPTPYVVGDMHFEEIAKLITDLDHAVDIVGLGICEYMPWDAIALQKTMQKISLFQD